MSFTLGKQGKGKEEKDVPLQEGDCRLLGILPLPHSKKYR